MDFHCPTGYECSRCREAAEYVSVDRSNIGTPLCGSCRAFRDIVSGIIAECKSMTWYGTIEGKKIPTKERDEC